MRDLEQEISRFWPQEKVVIMVVDRNREMESEREDDEISDAELDSICVNIVSKLRPHDDERVAQTASLATNLFSSELDGLWLFFFFFTYHSHL